MTHLLKWPNKFSDVFISSITDDSVSYMVMQKDTGVLMEPPRTTKYIIDEIGKWVHIDNRQMPLNHFMMARNILS